MIIFSKNKMIKNESGITLTVLVITIIVMLILAGASIATISGNEGIITQTRTAVNDANGDAVINDVKIAVSKIAIQWDGNDTIQKYIIDKLQAYEEGYELEDGAKITVSDDGIITYTYKTGEKFELYDGENEMYLKIAEDGNVVVEKKMD